MATTNLTSKSLGDILTQSGNGTPDHVAPIGSLYVDVDSGSLYQNKDGNTIWEILNTVSYGEAFYVGNTTATSIPASNTWYSVANNFTAGDLNGFTVSTNTMVLSAGRSGTYRIEGGMTIVNVANASIVEGGLSINGATPLDGFYNGVSINTTYTTNNITFSGEVFLNAGDILRLAIRNTNTTNNVIVRHGQIHAYKIG
jgi:hypothetical protein